MNDKYVRILKEKTVLSVRYWWIWGTTSNMR